MRPTPEEERAKKTERKIWVAIIVGAVILMAVAGVLAYTGVIKHH